MKWEPSDWLRMVALSGAIIVFAMSAWPVIGGASAEAAIDITAATVYGNLKAGIIGVAFALLAFIVIVFVLASPPRQAAASPEQADERVPRTKRLLPVFWGLLASGVCAVIAATTTGGSASFGFSALAVLLGFFLLVVTVVLLAFLQSE